MGVTGLHSWAERRGLGKRVVLSAPPPGAPHVAPRVLVLDACAGMLNFFGAGSLVGDFAALRSNVAAFVAHFDRAGVRLIVVIDGAVQEEKFARWLSRRRKEVRTVQQLNDGMQGGAGGKRGLVWLPPAFSQTYLGQAFRAAGCTVLFTAVEADRVVAGVCAAAGALGVLGRDSDFLVLPLGDAASADSTPTIDAAPAYHDFSTLRFPRAGSVSVVAFAPRDVHAALGLPPQALPILAASLGFDVHKRSRTLSDALTAADATTAAEGDPAAGAESDAVEVAAAALRQRIAEAGCARAALVPRSAREADAVAWYAPVVPEEYQDGVAHGMRNNATVRPHYVQLLARRYFVGPLTFEELSPRILEDAAAHPSVFEATAALRTAVYARTFGGGDATSAATTVTELLCSARRDSAWPLRVAHFGGVQPALSPAAVLAAAPAGEAPAVALARHVVATWLAPHVSPRHAAALVAQAQPAARAASAAAARTVARPLRLRDIRAADAHAASLFLVAMDTFCWGGDGDVAVDPPVWDLFDGPTFHGLCRGGAGRAAPLPPPVPGAPPARAYVSRRRAEAGAVSAVACMRRPLGVSVAAQRPPRRAGAATPQRLRRAGSAAVTVQLRARAVAPC